MNRFRDRPEEGRGCAPEAAAPAGSAAPATSAAPARSVEGAARRPGSNRSLYVLAGTVAALVVLAWLNRFVQDDAFISFRYARNLIEGHGLTFNPGERVEGYTNFLWTLLIAAGMALGLDPVGWSWALGLGAFTGSLLVTYRLTAELSSSTTAAWIALILLGTNYSFSAYATGGLETQLQAFLVVAATWLATRRSPGLLAVASTVFGLALLTRLDSAVLLAAPAALVLARLARPGPAAGVGPPEGGTTAGARTPEPETGGRDDARRGEPQLADSPRHRRLTLLAAFILPGGLIVGGWLAWKLAYYGDILPNTYYVKVVSAASMLRGGHYVYRFFASYWLLPLLLLLLLARPRRLANALAATPFKKAWGIALLGSVALWCAYVTQVGGDFMEFRFMVPVLPVVMALIAWGLVEAVDDPRVRSAAVAVVVMGSALHGLTFWGVRDIESIDALAIHMEPDGGDWDEVGRTLGETFRGGDVLIAVAAAGAIPYYSGLPAVDMRGLVDPWVARHGHIVSTVPGHQRMAPLSYLAQRGVNLVIGHPQVVSARAERRATVPRDFLREYGLVDVDSAQLPATSRIVEVPMSDGRRIIALYLTPNPAVERAIAAGEWHTAPLVSY